MDRCPIFSCLATSISGERLQIYRDPGQDIAPIEYEWMNKWMDKNTINIDLHSNKHRYSKLCKALKKNIKKPSYMCIIMSYYSAEHST